MPPPKDPKKAKEWRRNLIIAWKNPERRKLISQILKGRKFSEETIRKMSEAAKKRVGDKNPFYKRKHTEETKRKIAKANSGENNVRYGKPAWNKGKKYSEKIRKKMSEVAKRIYRENPTIRKKISSSHKGRKFSEEHRLKISKKIKDFYKRNPEFNKLENNPLWQGGVSFHPYNVLFNKAFKDFIKEKYGGRCVYCRKEEKGCVHHINYTKDHSSLLNCIWVCTSCNSKFNVNRDYWFSYWCHRLNINPKDNIKEAERVINLDKEKLINFMKAEYKL